LIARLAMSLMWQPQIVPAHSSQTQVTGQGVMKRRSMQIPSNENSSSLLSTGAMADRTSPLLFLSQALVTILLQ
jgi:hypothetical protein